MSSHCSRKGVGHFGGAVKLSPSFKAAFLQSVDFVSITCLAALIGTIQLNSTSILLSSFFLSFLFFLTTVLQVQK